MAPEITEKKPAVPKEETRIDSRAVDAFTAMGFTPPFPDSLVSTYQSVKRRMDILRPDRMSPEGFAFTAFISDLIEGKAENPGKD